MRRLDRDMSSNDLVIEKCIEEAMVIRICCADDPVPYIIPLCYGHEVKEGRRVFYFHKNRNGHLAELLEKDPQVSFELEGDCGTFLDHEKRMCNMDYCSVIGRGSVSVIEDDDERKRAMDLLMEHYGHGDFEYDLRAMKAILMYRLAVDDLTCKATKGWRDKRGC